MGKMFKTVTRTWNPIIGCLHDCTYCWARALAETRLKDSPRYRDGFAPKLIESELRRKFKPGEFVLVSSMGDISCAKWEWRKRVLEVITRFPETNFLLQTKDPGWFHLVGLPGNVYAGTTIETNRDDLARQFTKAPGPFLGSLANWCSLDYSSIWYEYSYQRFSTLHSSDNCPYLPHRIGSRLGVKTNV